jgi:hypothetical protein
VVGHTGCAGDAFFYPTNPTVPIKQFPLAHQTRQRSHNGQPVTNTFDVETVATDQLQNWCRFSGNGDGSVKDGVAFVQRANKPSGEYPDGARGAGFPGRVVEQSGDMYYNDWSYCRRCATMKKRQAFATYGALELHQLPSNDVNDAAVHTASEKLLQHSLEPELH